MPAVLLVTQLQSYFPSAIPSAILTALLLPLVPVMVWKCWNLPPVPVTRWWSIGYGGLGLATIAATWRAEFWKARFDTLEKQKQSPQLQSQPKRLLLPRSQPSFQRDAILDADAFEFLYLVAQFVPRIGSAYDYHFGTKLELHKRTGNALPVSQSKGELSFPVLFLPSVCRTAQSLSSLANVISGVGSDSLVLPIGRCHFHDLF